MAAPPVWLVAPFVVLLGLIAAGPVLFPAHWHRRYPAYAVGLGALVAAYYLFAVDGGGAYVGHAVAEYVSFVALIGSLYVVSGGIFVETSLVRTPLANVALLAVGALLANVVGTTGASMLLIRPYLRINAGSLRPYHVVFFIFVVSNVGGMLTPIGDPPLFLGFLRGVPFGWTLEHLWPIWLLAVSLILLVFLIIDWRNRAPTTREALGPEGVPEALSTDGPLSPALPHGQTIRITGARHGLWLALVVGLVFLDPNVIAGVPDLHALGLPVGLREILLGAVAVAAYRTADPRSLDGNDFTFGPIREVAWLFAGIFLTMIPALASIESAAAANADVLTPSLFFWATGALSGVLDNAPTYLAFLSAAMGAFASDAPAFGGAFVVDNPEAVRTLAIPGVPPLIGTRVVQAISAAAVLFGAMTYVGNGPNFMVKAIAEAAGAPVPSFGTYIWRYALPVLLPIYTLVWFVFFSGHVVPPVALP